MAKHGPPHVGDALHVQGQFVSQPFADGRDLRDFIASVAAEPDLQHLDVVVAWAKRSGLSRLRGELEAIRARGAALRMIVGIDEDGATRQGLELARELFDSVHVFHDRSGRTFHPKVYVAWGDDQARLLVGSHNVTAGGVYYNYEAGLKCDLQLPADAALLDSIRKYVDRLYADAAVCKELTDATIAELLANPRYRIGDEDHRKAATKGDVPEELDTAVDVEDEPDPPDAAPSIFGGSAEPKRSAPAVSGAAKKAVAKKSVATKAVTKTAVAKPAPAGAPVTSTGVMKRWFKKMPASDAQHPPSATSAVTGNLRLTQAGHPIDQTHYFRHDFFAPVAWAGTPKPAGILEQAVVPFHVVINGSNRGIHNLRVDDAAYREAGQNNHTSVLHWDDLGPELAAADFTGYFVILERLANDSYRLEITPDDQGAGAFKA